MSVFDKISHFWHSGVDKIKSFVGGQTNQPAEVAAPEELKQVVQSAVTEVLSPELLVRKQAAQAHYLEQSQALTEYRAQLLLRFQDLSTEKQQLAEQLHAEKVKEEQLESQRAPLRAQLVDMDEEQTKLQAEFEYWAQSWASEMNMELTKEAFEDRLNELEEAVTARAARFRMKWAANKRQQWIDLQLRRQNAESLLQNRFWLKRQADIDRVRQEKETAWRYCDSELTKIERALKVMEGPRGVKSKLIDNYQQGVCLDVVQQFKEAFDGNPEDLAAVLYQPAVPVPAPVAATPTPVVFSEPAPVAVAPTPVVSSEPAPATAPLPEVVTVEEPVSAEVAEEVTRGEEVAPELDGEETVVAPVELASLTTVSVEESAPPTTSPISAVAILAPVEERKGIAEEVLAVLDLTEESVREEQVEERLDDVKRLLTGWDTLVTVYGEDLVNYTPIRYRIEQLFSLVSDRENVFGPEFQTVETMVSAATQQAQALWQDHQIKSVDTEITQGDEALPGLEEEETTNPLAVPNLDSMRQSINWLILEVVDVLKTIRTLSAGVLTPQCEAKVMRYEELQKWYALNESTLDMSMLVDLQGKLGRALEELTDLRDNLVEHQAEVTVDNVLDKIEDGLTQLRNNLNLSARGDHTEVCSDNLAAAVEHFQQQVLSNFQTPAEEAVIDALYVCDVKDEIHILNVPYMVNDVDFLSTRLQQCLERGDYQGMSRAEAATLVRQCRLDLLRIKKRFLAPTLTQERFEAIYSDYRHEVIKIANDFPTIHRLPTMESRKHLIAETDAQFFNERIAGQYQENYPLAYYSESRYVSGEGLDQMMDYFTEKQRLLDSYQRRAGYQPLINPPTHHFSLDLLAQYVAEMKNLYKEFHYLTELPQVSEDWGYWMQKNHELVEHWGFCRWITVASKILLMRAEQELYYDYLLDEAEKQIYSASDKIVFPYGSEELERTKEYMTPYGQLAVYSGQGREYSRYQDRNEDSLLYWRRGRRMACGVIDGAGGSKNAQFPQAGLDASLAINRTINQYFDSYFDHHPTPLNQAFRYADKQLKDAETVGYAVAAGFFLKNNQAECTWCGDAKLVVIRQGNVLWQSRDQLWVQRQIEAGHLGWQARYNGLNSDVTVAIGTVGSLKPGYRARDKVTYQYNDVLPQTEMLQIQADDILLFCSDGVSDKIAPGELAQLCAGKTGSVQMREAILKELWQRLSQSRTGGFTVSNETGEQVQVAFREGDNVSLGILKVENFSGML